MSFNIDSYNENMIYYTSKSVFTDFCSKQNLSLIDKNVCKLFADVALDHEKMDNKKQIMPLNLEKTKDETENLLSVGKIALFFKPEDTILFAQNGSIGSNIFNSCVHLRQINRQLKDPVQDIAVSDWFCSAKNFPEKHKKANIFDSNFFSVKVNLPSIELPDDQEDDILMNEIKIGVKVKFLSTKESKDICNQTQALTKDIYHIEEISVLLPIGLFESAISPQK